MRLTSSRTFIIGVLSLSTLFFAGEPLPSSRHPNFSGRWVLDLQRSQLNPTQRKNLTQGVAIIKHEEASFDFHREFTVAGQNTKMAFTLTIDGREVYGNEDGMPTRSSASWSGEELILLTIYKAPLGAARSTVRYSLHDAGKTLHAEESFRGPRLTYDNLWVFSRSE
jgi:hypothetical protein